MSKKNKAKRQHVEEPTSKSSNAKAKPSGNKSLSTEDAKRQLLTWFENNGIEYDDALDIEVTEKETGGFQFRVVAREDVEEGTVLIKVPRRMVFCVGRSGVAEEIENFDGSIGMTQGLDIALLNAATVPADPNGDQPNFHPYFSLTLLHSPPPPLPVFWDEDESKFLKGTDLETRLETLRDETIEALATSFKPFLEKHRDSFGKQLPPFVGPFGGKDGASEIGAFFWACGHAMQKRIFVDMQTGYGIVPLFDLLNHSMSLSNAIIDTGVNDFDDEDVEDEGEEDMPELVEEKEEEEEEKVNGKKGKKSSSKKEEEEEEGNDEDKAEENDFEGNPLDEIPIQVVSTAKIPAGEEVLISFGAGGSTDFKSTLQTYTLLTEYGTVDPPIAIDTADEDVEGNPTGTNTDLKFLLSNANDTVSVGKRRIVRMLESRLAGMYGENKGGVMLEWRLSFWAKFGRNIVKQVIEDLMEEYEDLTDLKDDEDFEDDDDDDDEAEEEEDDIDEEEDEEDEDDEGEEENEVYGDKKKKAVYLSDLLDEMEMEEDDESNIEDDGIEGEDEDEEDDEDEEEDDEEDFGEDDEEDLAEINAEEDDFSVGVDGNPTPELRAFLHLCLLPTKAFAKVTSDPPALFRYVRQLIEPLVVGEMEDMDIVDEDDIKVDNFGWRVEPKIDPFKTSETSKTKDAENADEAEDDDLLERVIAPLRRLKTTKSHVQRLAYDVLMDAIRDRDAAYIGSSMEDKFWNDAKRKRDEDDEGDEEDEEDEDDGNEDEEEEGSPFESETLEEDLELLFSMTDEEVKSPKGQALILRIQERRMLHRAMQRWFNTEPSAADDDEDDDQDEEEDEEDDEENENEANDGEEDEEDEDDFDEDVDLDDPNILEMLAAMDEEDDDDENEVGQGEDDDDDDDDDDDEEILAAMEGVLSDDEDGDGDVAMEGWEDEEEDL
ncbi:hypothetical protein HDU97_008420 [Phlyctochytrium planicorne]|nr:hypothetical protein HDU97_008420 [Phlyctochytrium planicorne]